MRCYTLLLGLVGCLAHSLLSGYAWLATAYTMSMNATRRVDHEFDSFVDWTPILETLLRLVLESSWWSRMSKPHKGLACFRRTVCVLHVLD